MSNTVIKTIQNTILSLKCMHVYRFRTEHARSVCCWPPVFRVLTSSCMGCSHCILHYPHARARTNSLCASFHHDHGIIHCLYTPTCLDFQFVPYNALHQSDILLSCTLAVEPSASLHIIRPGCLCYLAASDYFARR